MFLQIDLTSFYYLLVVLNVIFYPLGELGTAELGATS